MEQEQIYNTISKLKTGTILKESKHLKEFWNKEKCYYCKIHLVN